MSGVKTLSILLLPPDYAADVSYCIRQASILLMASPKAHYLNLGRIRALSFINENYGGELHMRMLRSVGSRQNYDLEGAFRLFLMKDIYADLVSTHIENKLALSQSPVRRPQKHILVLNLHLPPGSPATAKRLEFTISSRPRQ